MATNKVSIQIIGDASQFRGVLKGVKDDAENFGQRMGAAGRKMTTHLSLPILGIGTAAAKLGVDFDESMQKIVSLVGLSQGTVDEMKGSVLALAGETAKAPAELAEAMFFITSAGLRGSDALEALGASAKASAAGLGETAGIADAVTSAMNAYGAENLSATEATDILLATVREGKLEASELGSSLGKVIPIAAELGVGFDEVGAAVATMSRVGIDAETGTTALRGVMSTLIKPTAEAESTLAEFGTSAGELREKIKSEGLLAVLLDLKLRFGDNEEAMGKVFSNVRALTGVLAIVGTDAGTAESIFGTLADSTGDMETAFESASSTVGFEVKQAFIDLQRAGIDMAETLTPVVRSLADIISTLVEGFRNLSPGVQKAIVVIGGIVAVVGPAILIASGLVSAFKAVGAAFSVLRVILLSNPFIALAAAVIALVILIVANWDKIKAAAVVVKDWIVEKFTAVVDFFRGLPAKVRAATSGMWDGIKEAFRAAINWLIRKWNDFELGFSSIQLPALLGGGTITLPKFKTPDIPEFHTGGRINAPRGQEVLVRALGGEEISNPNHSGGSGSKGVTINISTLDSQSAAAAVEDVLVDLNRRGVISSSVFASGNTV